MTRPAPSSAATAPAKSRNDEHPGRVPLRRVVGCVIRGFGRGRGLGFPTANLAGPCPALRDGVYAVTVGIDGEPPWRPGIASVGPIPTFDVHGRRLEVHLLDFAGDLYGSRLAVSFHRRLAGLRRCSSPAALAARIERLVARARRVLAERAARGDQCGVCAG